MADETDNHTLRLLRRMDAKLDRVQSTLDDHTGRLQRLEGRMTQLDARVGDEPERRIRRLEDTPAG